jgi:hypothetical protein
MDDDNICSCKKKMYGYTDGTHTVFICYRCGRYSGQAGGDVLFVEVIMNDPLILMKLISEKILKPIK